MKFERQLRPSTETSWVVSYGGKTIPRWRTAAILKIDISPYLSESHPILTAFFVHSSRFWTAWTSRDQKWKSCIGQTPSLTECVSCILFIYYGRLLSVAWAKSMLYFANVFYLFFMAALFSGPGEWRFAKVLHLTLSVIREVTIWIFSWSSLNYRVSQKVTKFGIFSDPARKLSDLTPECGRIL